jgi:PAS domain S-box-containing protein
MLSNTNLFEHVDFKGIINSISDIICTIDKDFRITFWNKTVEEISGKPADFAVNSNLLDIFPELKDSTPLLVLKDILQTKTRQSFEQSFNLDGNLRYYKIDAYPYGDNIIIMGKDITEYKKYETAVKLSEQRYQNTLDNMMEGCAIINYQWEVVYANEANSRHTGLGRENLIGQKISELFPDLNNSNLFDTLKKVMVERIPQDTITSCSLNDGLLRWYELKAVPVPEGIFILSEEVTDKKIAEDALLHYQSILIQSEELSHTGTWWLDVDESSRYIDESVHWSDEVYRIFGYQPGEVEITQKLFLSHIHPDDRDMFINSMYAAKENKQPYKVEFRIRRPDGSERILMETGTHNYDSSGSVTRLVGAVQDITEFRNLMKENALERNRLQHAIKEKEILLRELYHRTKNNLQVISSLLGLKASSLKEKEASRVFEEMQNRIQAISMVHQKLYQSKDLSQINLKDYINDLSDLLARTYSFSVRKVFVNKDLQDVNVVLDTAVPCGLIINELVSNSFKHAFPGNMSGNISISLRRLENGTLELRISDNGISKDEIENNRTLGMQLFRIIAEEQLHAEVVQESGQGTSWTIRFKDEFSNKTPGS